MRAAARGPRWRCRMQMKRGTGAEGVAMATGQGGGRARAGGRRPPAGGDIESSSRPPPRAPPRSPWNSSGRPRAGAPEEAEGKEWGKKRLRFKTTDQPGSVMLLSRATELLAKNTFFEINAFSTNALLSGACVCRSSKLRHWAARANTFISTNAFPTAVQFRGAAEWRRVKGPMPRRVRSATAREGGGRAAGRRGGRAVWCPSLRGEAEARVHAGPMAGRGGGCRPANGRPPRDRFRRPAPPPAALPWTLPPPSSPPAAPDPRAPLALPAFVPALIARVINSRRAFLWVRDGGGGEGEGGGGVVADRGRAGAGGGGVAMATGGDVNSYSEGMQRWLFSSIGKKRIPVHDIGKNVELSVSSLDSNQQAQSGMTCLSNPVYKDGRENHATGLTNNGMGTEMGVKNRNGSSSGD
ncbi:Protein of unknown function [Gryllus bimaculatus]|nr:Protein of unknown function [Gryllus bimaculatus]